MAVYEVRPAEEVGLDTDNMSILSVDDPKASALIEGEDEGEGPDTLRCAKCKETIVENFWRENIQGVGFECLGCGSILYVPASD